VNWDDDLVRAPMHDASPDFTPRHCEIVGLTSDAKPQRRHLAGENGQAGRFLRTH
jgi:hypothetical protein